MFPSLVEPVGDWRRVIRSRVGGIRTRASALSIALGIGARDGCFQTTAAGGEYLKLRLDSLLFDFELTATRFSQFLGMCATHTCQTTLDIFRLKFFFELL